MLEPVRDTKIAPLKKGASAQKGSPTLSSIQWGAQSAHERGPIVSHGAYKNVIGGNISSTWAALGQAQALQNGHTGSKLHTSQSSVARSHTTENLQTPQKTDFTGHLEAWLPAVYDNRIVSLDPWGECLHLFGPELQQHYDLRPSIASCEAWLQIPEIEHSIQTGQLKVDGQIVCPHRDAASNILSNEASQTGSASNKGQHTGPKHSGPKHSSNQGYLKNNSFFQHQVKAWQISIDPVWYLPGIAQRLQLDEHQLRQALYERTGITGLIDQPEKQVFLPPVGGTSVYIFGSREALKTGPVCLRIHDECNSSDVFGSDVCTCRPYLMYSLQYAIKAAQQGGAGVILYCRKEGRGFGEVPKFWACHQRHAWQSQASGAGFTATSQPSPSQHTNPNQHTDPSLHTNSSQNTQDHAAKSQLNPSQPNTPSNKQLDAQVENFIQANLNVAGVHDLRFHQLVPEVLHWLGVTRVHEFLSMNTNKLQALQNQGIQVEKSVPIDENLVTQKARIEVAAKKHTPPVVPTQEPPTAQTGAATTQESTATQNVTDTHFLPPLSTAFKSLSPDEQAHSQIDLAFISGLIAITDSLDWQFKHHNAQLKGLQALNTATLQMFIKGGFSSEADRHPLRADSLGLFNLTQTDLQQAFQVHLFNPLAGMAQRIALIHSLADVLHQNDAHFGTHLAKRPSDLVKHSLLFQNTKGPLQLSQLYKLLKDLMANNLDPQLQNPQQQAHLLQLAHLLVQPLQQLGFQVQPDQAIPTALWYS